MKPLPKRKARPAGMFINMFICTLVSNYALNWITMMYVYIGILPEEKAAEAHSPFAADSPCGKSTFV